MSSTAISYSNLALDWSPESKRDHTFNLIAIVAISTALALGIIFSTIHVPKDERKARVVVPERIAKFITQKPKVKTPPKVKPKPPPPPPKPRVIRKKPKDRTPLSKAQKKARKKAEKSGILAFANDLSDLMDTDSISKNLGTKSRKSSRASKRTKIDTAALTSNATTGSGGVSSDKYTTSVGTTQLSASERVALAKALKSGSIDSVKSRSRNDRLGDQYRSEEEITLTMDRNKGKLYSAYARVLRRSPGLKGKIVFEITIAPSGKVTNVRIKMSELNHPALEKSLIARIKGFVFGQRSVEKVTITYPIEFLPS